MPRHDTLVLASLAAQNAQSSAASSSSPAAPAVVNTGRNVAASSRSSADRFVQRLASVAKEIAIVTTAASAPQADAQKVSVEVLNLHLFDLTDFDIVQQAIAMPSWAWYLIVLQVLVLFLAFWKLWELVRQVTGRLEFPSGSGRGDRQRIFES